MATAIAAVGAVALGTANAGAQPRDVAPDTWGFADALGRTAPAAPAPRDRAVMMFYFVWHGAHGYDEHRQPPPDGSVWPKEDRDYASPYDLSRILAAAGDGAPAYGPVHAFHHWGEPHLGYYLSDDEAVIRRHALLLADAGVDAIAIDVTNALAYSAICRRLLDVYATMRAQGLPTPQIAFLANAGARAVTDRLWREVYAPGLHEELWFRWKGRPLLLAPPDDVDPAIRDRFTIRRSWAWSAAPWFGDGRDRWPWLDHFPQRPGWHDDPTRPEQLAVAVAQHPTSNIGRSFHDGREPPTEDQRPELGLCFEEQWRRAHEVDPELVFVTGWNEWVAMRFLADGTQSLAGRKLEAGESFFVDLWSQEYSRDIEPMRGGHGDLYYWQLVDHVRRYKGARAVTPPSPPVSFALDDLAAWNDVGPDYLDHQGDDFGRDHPGFGSAGPYRRPRARNDLVLAKVARDDDHLTFLIRAARPLTAPTSPERGAADWMLLYVDADRDPATGFASFDLVVGASGYGPEHGGTEDRGAEHGGAGEVAVEALGETFDRRRKVGVARYLRSGTDLVVRLPRALVAAADDPPAFHFQWVDGAGASGDPLDWIDRGDAAPDARFTYRYLPRR